MKKLLSLVICLALLFSLTGCRRKAGYQGAVKIWVAENTVAFTEKQVAAFQKEYPEYADITITVEPVGENDAANNMLTDVEAGADLYGFAQDQLARLVGAGALEQVPEEHAAQIEAENDAASVAAVQVGQNMYAYPVTSDNGYFLYYDRSVITDPTSLEQILADCEQADKRFYMEINSGWYQTAFFFGAGCTLAYTTDDAGRMTGITCDYASENGIRALRSMIRLAQSPAFVNGSSASNATRLGAIVSGVWDAGVLENTLGENYAAARLPMVDGYQLSGFGGFKMLGVKPQTDADKLAVCDALALYLTSEQVQKARFDAVGWGPSNKNAQNSPAVRQDAALAALADQLQFTVSQGQYPGEYWALATALADDVLAHKYDDYSDEQLMDVLSAFQSTAASYVTP